MGTAADIAKLIPFVGTLAGVGIGTMSGPIMFASLFHIRKRYSRILLDILSSKNSNEAGNSRLISLFVRLPPPDSASSPIITTPSSLDLRAEREEKVEHKAEIKEKEEEAVMQRAKEVVGGEIIINITKVEAASSKVIMTTQNKEEPMSPQLAMMKSPVLRRVKASPSIGCADDDDESRWTSPKKETEEDFEHLPYSLHHQFVIDERALVSLDGSPHTRRRKFSFLCMSFYSFIILIIIIIMF